LRVGGAPGEVRAHRIDVRPVHPLELGGPAGPGSLPVGSGRRAVPAVFSVTYLVAVQPPSRHAPH
jgi:hypothetical protein